MSLKKVISLAKDSLIYGFAGVISRMITFFLVPLYTRIFAPSDYGIIFLINTTLFLVGLLSACALESAAARWYYDTKDEVERKKTVASWFWFQFGSTTVGIVILLLATPLFSNHLIKVPPQQFRPLWILACCTLITNVLPSIIERWYRFTRRPKSTIAFTLSQSLVTIMLTLLFVVVYKWGIIGIYAALLISGVSFSIIALLQLRSWISIKFFQKVRIKDMLYFSLPLVPASLAFWLLNSTDAYFIQFFKNKTEVGLFSVGASLASGVTLFTGAFQQAWGPFAFSMINEPEAKKTYANVFLVFGILSSVILLGMFLFTPEILRLLTTANYYGAAWVASILSLNVVLIAFTYIASIGTNIVKNNKYYSIGIIIAAVITVVLDVILIPVLGKEGSAIATVLAQAIVPIYLFYHAQKLYPIKYEFGKVTFFILLSIALGTIGRFIEYRSLSVAIFSKTFIVLFFLCCAFFIIRGNLKMVLIKIRGRNSQFT